MSTTTRFAPIAPLLKTDAYKIDHRRVYGLSGDVTRVYSNYTNRKSLLRSVVDGKPVDKVVHFGLQAFIAKNLMDEFEPFFDAPENQVCRLYEERITAILGPNQVGSDHIRALHRLGYLPLRFCAVPEGTLVPIRVPSFTVENTLPEFFWLTNYIETALSTGVWQASTSATIAHEYRRLLDRAALETTGTVDGVDYQAHDFSYRGMSSDETAAASGAGHLLSFQGSDSLVTMDWIDRYYGGRYVLNSVPATEHSVMCTGIASMGEQELFEKILDLYPTGIVSIVSDTFDLWNVLTKILPALKDKIMARDGKVVIRPDSGDPEKILCGDPDAPMGTPAHRGVLSLLRETFGGEYNDRGYLQIDPHVGAIYGDSINLARAASILDNMASQQLASSNVVFGVGSFTYQYNTRDTFGSAIKATWAEVDEDGVNLFKDPVTDDGTKKSATGRLAVLPDWDGNLMLVQKATPDQEEASLLQPVWANGRFLRFQSFADVRGTLHAQRLA